MGRRNGKGTGKEDKEIKGVETLRKRKKGIQLVATNNSIMTSRAVRAVWFMKSTSLNIKKNCNIFHNAELLKKNK